MKVIMLVALLMFQTKPADTRKPVPEKKDTPVYSEAAEAAFGVAGRGPIRPMKINDELRVQPLRPDTWVIVHEQPWAANSLLVQMPDGTLVLCDTPYDDAATSQLIAWIRRTFGADSEIVAINSHFHADAMGGNGALKAAGVTSYGSKMSAQLLGERGTKLKAQLLSHLTEKPELHARFKDVTWEAPAEQFDPAKGMELTFGEEKVVLFYPGPGHAPDNIVTWFPKRRILFGGCLVQAGKQIANDVDADLAAWPETIDALRAFDAESIVPGHGKVGGPALLDYTKKLVATHVASKQ